MNKQFFNAFMVFVMPFLAFFTPLQNSLIALGVIILFNYILAVIASFKDLRGFSFRFFKSLVAEQSFSETRNKVFDYIFALLLIGMFEVYFFDVSIEDMSNKLLSFTHLSLVFIGYKEVKRGFAINEKITGTNFYEEIQGFLPEKFKNMFKSSPNK